MGKLLERVLSETGKLTRTWKREGVGCKVSFEIVIVDDGSSDGTGRVLKEFEGTDSVAVFRHKVNLGKGAALITAIGEARGDIVLTQDADLEYDPKYYKRLLEPLVFDESLDVVYGSRLSHLPLNLANLRTIPLPFNFLANKVLSQMYCWLYANRLTDIETGYKAIRTGLVQRLGLDSGGFDIEIELTAKLTNVGASFAEVPITSEPRDYSEGKKITPWDGVVAVIKLFRYRLRRHRLWLVLILVLAASLRLYRMEHRVALWQDQARDALVGRVALREGRVPLIGSFSSAGPFTFGPVWYYYTAAAALMPSVWQLYFVGGVVISLSTVVGFYLLGKELGGGEILSSPPTHKASEGHSKSLSSKGLEEGVGSGFSGARQSSEALKIAHQVRDDKRGNGGHAPPLAGRGLGGVRDSGVLLGLWAALIAGVSPAVVGSTLANTQHTLVGAFSVWFLYFTLRYVRVPSVFDLTVASVFLSLSINAHYQAFYLLPVFGLALLSRRINLRALVSGAVAGAVVWLPMVWFDATHHWWNWRKLVDYYRFGQYRIYVPNRWLTYALEFWPTTWGDVVGGPVLAYAIMGLIGILFLMGVYKRSLTRAEVVVGLGFLLSIVWFRYFRGERLTAYMVYSYGFIIVWTAWMLVHLRAVSGRLYGLLAVGILAAFVPGLYRHLNGVNSYSSTLNLKRELVRNIGTDVPVALYDYQFANVGCSHALSFLLDDEGLSRPDGIPVGVCNSPECANADLLGSVRSTTLSCNLYRLAEHPDPEDKTWTNVTPERLHADTVEWWRRVDTSE